MKRLKPADSKITQVTWKLSVCCHRDAGLVGESSGEETGDDKACLSGCGYVLANVSLRHTTGQNSRVTFGAAEADFRELKSVCLLASQVSVPVASPWCCFPRASSS